MSIDLVRQWAIEADLVAPGPDTADDLWQAADVIDASAELGRALTERTAAPTDTVGLVERLFADHVAQSTLVMLDEAVALDWDGPDALVSAIRIMAVRVTWREAEQQGVIDRVRAEIADLIGADSRLDLAFGSIVYPVEERERMLDRLVGAAVHPLTMRLARFAIQAERAGGLDRALDAWLDEAARLRGRLRASATFAIVPDSQQQARLASELARIYGSPVDVQVRVDKNVLGGVRVEIADEVIDGSAAHQLQEARESLTRP